jgi:hypothetical protein
MSPCVSVTKPEPEAVDCDDCGGPPNGPCDWVVEVPFAVMSTTPGAALVYNADAVVASVVLLMAVSAAAGALWVTVVVPNDPVSLKTAAVPMLPMNSAVAASSAVSWDLRFVMAVPSWRAGEVELRPTL